MRTHTFGSLCDLFSLLSTVTSQCCLQLLVKVVALHQLEDCNLLLTFEKRVVEWRISLMPAHE